MITVIQIAWIAFSLDFYTCPKVGSVTHDEDVSASCHTSQELSWANIKGPAPGRDWVVWLLRFHSTLQLWFEEHRSLPVTQVIWKSSVKTHGVLSSYLSTHASFVMRNQAFVMSAFYWQFCPCPTHYPTHCDRRDRVQVSSSTYQHIPALLGSVWAPDNFHCAWLSAGADFLLCGSGQDQQLQLSVGWCRKYWRGDLRLQLALVVYTVDPPLL